jgi:transcriptional regulator with XRE-family HTH domain
VADTSFSRWLDETLNRQGVSVRELARRVAQQHPVDDPARNLETVRRALNKYRHEGRIPSAPMKRAIADALGEDADSIPNEDDPSDRFEAMMRDPQFQRAAEPLLRMFARAARAA